jgi:4-hydroxythreonine-4-phosphate dehydrogenase
MLVVADDLSGAVEVASVLGARRIALGHTDGDVIDLGTRELPPDEAARRIRALNGRVMFKKIDSLLRGNVQAEIEALTGDVIVAPALPVEGRTVRDGVLHVHGVPQPTPRIALLDADTDEDLDAIVAAAPPGATLVGSAGLAAALGRRLGATPLPKPHPSGRDLLVAVGTRAAGEQLARLAATGIPVVTADAARSESGLLGRRAAAIGGAVPLARPAAGRRAPVVAVRGRADELAAVVASSPPVDLVLTGGETARRTLDALGVTTLEAIAQIHHGAVQCRAPDGRHVTIRPGSFGGPESLVRIVECLSR